MEEAFDEHRRECAVPGARIVRGDQVDVKSMMSKKAYVDKFKEGEWVPLYEYLTVEAGIPEAMVDTLPKQLEVAEKALGTCTPKPDPEPILQSPYTCTPKPDPHPH